MAEGSHCRVVVRPRPLAKYIRQTEKVNNGAVSVGQVKQCLLGTTLTAAIRVVQLGLAG
ncbi:hypothetical protein D9M71_598080 [compost metagenome]